jgi:predicted nuclease of predicted toxin-antitoxin system
VHLVADESCDYAIVSGLRAAGHDVISITETFSGAEDARVIDLASSQRRLLITEDKDFGQLVFSAAKQNSGVVLIRYPVFARAGLVETLVQLLLERGDALYSCFVVLEPGRMRLGRLIT